MTVWPALAALLTLLPMQEPDKEPDTPPAREPVPEPADGGFLSGLTDPAEWRVAAPHRHWTDIHLFAGWRIQEHASDGRCRLLDDAGKLRHAGTHVECRAALKRFRERLDLRPTTGRVVLLLHGMLRSPASMAPMAEHLRQAGFATETFGYASSRLPIQRHGAALRRLIEQWEGPTRIDLVTHSMGGLVVRSALSERPDPRVGSVVMLAPPNQGACRADAWQQTKAYRELLGPSGQQMVTAADGFCRTLPPPPVPFAVIAGGIGRWGFSLLIPGDDDGTVGVDEARLDGMSDFLVVRAQHTFLIRSRAAREAVVRWLRDGRLRRDGEGEIGGEGEKEEDEQERSPAP